MIGGNKSGIDWAPETRTREERDRGIRDRSGIDRGLNLGAIGA